MSRGARRLFICAAGAVLVAAMLPTTGLAWSTAVQTNVIELDPGMCGQLLQIGSDPTASNTDNPTFLMTGDGGLSSYSLTLDGRSIGTFASDGHANVCISVPAPLADGQHVLTGVELAPRPSLPVTPFTFTVDTVPPHMPSMPILSTYSDSGVLGDGITKFGMINLTGVADPADRVLIYNGPTGLGGSTTDSSGHWSATTQKLADGTYAIQAATYDRAGNRSARTAVMSLTIDSVAPATPGAASLVGTDRDGNPIVAGAAASDVARISVFVDGVGVGSTATVSGAWRFTLSGLATGSHDVSVSGADAADNATPRSGSLTVTIAPPPPPPASEPVEAPAPPPQDPAPSPPPANSAPVAPPASEPVTTPTPPEPAPEDPPVVDSRPAPPENTGAVVPRPPRPGKVPS